MDTVIILFFGIIVCGAVCYTCLCACSLNDVCCSCTQRNFQTSLFYQQVIDENPACLSAISVLVFRYME